MPAIPGPSSEGAEKPARHTTSAFIASNGAPDRPGPRSRGRTRDAISRPSGRQRLSPPSPRPARTPFAPVRAPGHRSLDGRTLAEYPVVTTSVIGLWSQLLHSISRRILRQRPLDSLGYGIPASKLADAAPTGGSIVGEKRRNVPCRISLTLALGTGCMAGGAHVAVAQTGPWRGSASGCELGSEFGRHQAHHIRGRCRSDISGELS